MSELILFICIFFITCGYMKIGKTTQNKKIINYGLLGLFYLVCYFCLGAICSQLFLI